jgi:hypothetical protein
MAMFLDTEPRRNTIQFIRRKNQLAPGIDFEEDESIYRLTLVFSIACVGYFPTIPVGLAQRKPFWNVVGTQKQLIWFKDLNYTTILAARRTVIKYLDAIAGRIAAGDKIVDVKVTLIDWKTDLAVPNSILKEKWFTNRTFGDLILDGKRCRSWGINVDHLEMQEDNAYFVKDAPKVDLEAVLPFSLDDVIYSIIASVITIYPKWLKRTTKLDDKRIAYCMHRIIGCIRTFTFVQKIKTMLKTRFENDSAFAEALSGNFAMTILRREVGLWIESYIRDNLLPKGIKGDG